MSSPNPRAFFQNGYVRVIGAPRASSISVPSGGGGGSQGGGQGRGGGQGGGKGSGIGQGVGGGKGHAAGAALAAGQLANALVVFATKPGFSPAVNPLTYRQTVLASVPTGYWKLDETSGTTATDSSGNGFDAPLSAVPTLNVSPLINSGKAMTFNGTTQAGQTGRNVFLPATLGTISLEGWIQSTAAVFSQILCADDTTFIRYFQWTLLANGTTTAALFSGGVGTNFTLPAVVNDGVRHHLVFTYDGTTGRLYVDNVQSGTGIVNAGKLVAGGNGTFAVSIAKRNSSGSDTSFLAATLDELAVYERVLTQAEVTAHWLAGK